MPPGADSDAPSGGPGSTRVGRAPSEPSIHQPAAAEAHQEPEPVAFAKTATPNTAGTSADLPTLPPVDPSTYTVGFEIARGGMGRIFAARDRKLRRDIVIKSLVPGGHTPRFEREALITARLQHPSIVTVYDAGQLNGEPFYAMEHVRGKSLDKVVAAAEDAEARLALLPHVIAIADALAYAHSEGVIHRDLKPANVLVGSFGETIVIDWGLAKDLRRGEPDSLDPDRSASPAAPVGALGAADLTVEGAVMGTPSYMPPEQARGEATDERSDVYAIGAILYTVLAGTPPITGMRALDDARAGGVTPLRERAPEAPAELVTIVEHAMAFDPRERYASARELAEDLRRFAAGKLVARHAYTTGELARRWLRRNRAPVAIAGAALAFLVVLSLVWVRGLAGERDEAREETVVARTSLERAEDASDDLALHQAERTLASDPSHAIAWLQRLSPRGLERPRARELADAAAKRGVAFELAGPRAPITHLAIAQPAGTAYTASSDGQLFRYQLAAFRSDSLGAHAAPIVALAVSPDGWWIATASSDRDIRLWNLDTVQSHPGPKHGGTPRALAFSPDGNTLASAADDGSLWLWTIAKGEGRAIRADAAALGPLAWHPDGTHLHVATADGRVLGFDATAGKLVSTHRPHTSEIRALAISRDGKRIASGGRDGSVQAWELAGGKPRAYATHAGGVRDLAWTADHRLVTAGDDAAIHLLDFASNKTTDFPATIAPVHDVALGTVAFAAASADGKVRVWSPASWDTPRVLVGHRAPITAVAFTADQSKLLSVAEDRLRMWPLGPIPPAPGGRELATWLASRTNLAVAPRETPK